MSQATSSLMSEFVYTAHLTQSLAADFEAFELPNRPDADFTEWCEAWYDPYTDYMLGFLIH